MKQRYSFPFIKTQTRYFNNGEIRYRVIPALGQQFCLQKTNPENIAQTG
jgi:hypothetical protein